MESTGKTILTVSSIKKFRDCRQAYNLRYNYNLVAKQTDFNLSFGSLWHGALERWYRNGASEETAEMIRGWLNESTYARHQGNERAKYAYNLATAMFNAYIHRYPTIEWKIVDVEKVFSVPIINPHTGRTSRTFDLWGKVDLVLDIGGYLLISEHKTASNIGEGYVERLPLDLQANLYSEALSRFYGRPVVGVIYNAVAKKKLKQSVGETQEEYEIRLREACRKNALSAMDKLKQKDGESVIDFEMRKQQAYDKSFKSSAKRQMPESDEDFQKRLLTAYEDSSMFLRQQLTFDRRDRHRVLCEVWEITQQMIQANRRKYFSMNDGQCAFGSRRCQYHPLCLSHGNEATLESMYETKSAHSELVDDENEEPDFDWDSIAL